VTNPAPYGEYRPPEPGHYGPPVGPAGPGGYGPVASGGYGPPGGAGYPPPRGTNGMAIASLVCAFLFFPLGIVFGHLALSQIKRTKEDGHGLAVAGLVISYVVAVLTVLAVILIVVIYVGFAALLIGTAGRSDFGYPATPGIGDSQVPAQPLPAFKPPATLGSNCQYPATTEPASKPVTPPRTGRATTTPPTIGMKLGTNDGGIGLVLDNAKAPCTVNNFTSLAKQGYFDNTTCHRLTTSPDLGVLQCGDPSGSGSGGPGYRFPNEYPTNQYRIADPALQQPVVYPRGTLAMANAGAGTNGSQFFLVYKDSQLPPSYTAFGTIDTVGLATLDKIAAGGVQGGSDDGKPVTNVTIQSARPN
jgi:peptidyl-prolyl cis-trans isomerase B (cyclophilin B)